MSTILYYSNFCDHSKKMLQTFSKSALSKEIHFICIDNRVQDDQGKTMLVLENGSRIVLPQTIVRVPALLLLNQNYQVLFGEDIYRFFAQLETTIKQQATHQNMEPSAFSFQGLTSGFGIVSDQFSFLDADADAMKAQGNGGLRQMHNYVTTDYMDTIQNTQEDNYDFKSSGKLSQDITVEKLQQMRQQEMESLTMSNAKSGK